MPVNINGGFMMGLAAVISAIGSSFAAVFAAMNHSATKDVAKDTKEVMRQTNGINSVLVDKNTKMQTRIDAQDQKIADLQNGGTT